jgi:predicted acyltransferase
MSSPTATEPTPETQTSSSSAPERLVSLDVLRGFDMFWIIGGGPFVVALARYFDNAQFTRLIEYQTEHVGWSGFVAWDLIFALFVFVSGAAMPFSLTAKLQRGTSKWVLYRRVFQRSLLLIVLGISPDLFAMDFEHLRPLSVLGLIGVAYFFAALIVLNRGPRGQFAWLVGILLGYWAALMFIPVPGIGAGVITPGGCLGGYIDSYLLPGQLYQGVFDPEGILNMMSATATALMGALAGYLLRSRDQTRYQNVAILLGAGLATLGMGLLWGHSLPVVKAIWSSSFVLVAGGWSLILLALFYLVIDIWRLRWLGFVFVPIGMNAITIYVGHGYIDFQFTSDLIFGGLARTTGADLAPIVTTAGLLVVEWALLYFLYRKRIFLRV